MGYQKFISDAKKSGIDGFILPDMSLEESKDYLNAAKDNADTIFLISPNTTKTRIDKINADPFKKFLKENILIKRNDNFS